MASLRFMYQILLEDPGTSWEASCSMPCYCLLVVPTFFFFLSLEIELRTCNVSCPSPEVTRCLLRLADRPLSLGSPIMLCLCLVAKMAPEVPKCQGPGASATSPAISQC